MKLISTSILIPKTEHQTLWRKLSQFNQNNRNKREILSKKLLIALRLVLKKRLKSQYLPHQKRKSPKKFRIHTLFRIPFTLTKTKKHKYNSKGSKEKKCRRNLRKNFKETKMTLRKLQLTVWINRLRRRKIKKIGSN